VGRAFTEDLTESFEAITGTAVTLRAVRPGWFQNPTLTRASFELR
jgi:hypothetical protein